MPPMTRGAHYRVSPSCYSNNDAILTTMMAIMIVIAVNSRSVFPPRCPGLLDSTSSRCSVYIMISNDMR